MTTVGIVLGAGGVTGDAFHRGVLRALWQIGYDARTADVIVGTSAGSMVGAFLRRPDRRPEPVALAEESVHGQRLGRLPDLTPMVATLRRPWRARAGVLATALLPTGRRSTEFLVTGVRAQHGQAWPDRPLYICAVRRRDGRRVVFGRDGAPPTDLAHAVAASCAIPGFFHPVQIDGEAYVDGGVHSPTNADVLRDWQLDVLIVSSPMSIDVRGGRPTLDVLPRLHAHRYLQRETRPFRQRGTTVITFEPGDSLLSVMGLNPLRGSRIHEIEKASCQRASEVLAADGNVEALRSRPASAGTSRARSRP